MEQLGLFECEELARQVREFAGFEPHQIVSAPRIALRVLGDHAVRTIPRVGSLGALVRLPSGYTIFLQSGTRDANFVVAHELGHWALLTMANYAGADEEVLSDRIGAAIVASPEAVRSAVQEHGDDEQKLAPLFYSTESLIALRVAEVMGLERALHVPRSTRPERVVTQGTFNWGPPGTVSSWAKGRAPSEVRKTRLRAPYDRGRTVLKVG